MSQGIFITFEGIDGSGKSTQARLLATLMRDYGNEVILTREPGGSAGAEDIRQLLVKGNPGRWSPETEILLFTAARRDHLERTIQPALDLGKVVISDRFVDSTRVYQGVARAELRSTVDALHDKMVAKEPDLTFIIDMDPEAALMRGLARNSGEDRFEEMGLQFQMDLRAGFLSLAEHYPDRCEIISGNQSPAMVSGDIQSVIEAWIS